MILFAQLEAEPIRWPTVVKVLLAFWPRVVIAARQPTMIRANMTAYSTAVGPSSRWMKSTAASYHFRMTDSPFSVFRPRWAHSTLCFVPRCWELMDGEIRHPFGSLATWGDRPIA